MSDVSSSASSSASTPSSSPRASHGAGDRPAALDDSSCSAFVADTSKVTVHIADVNAHLLCGLCDGYLNDAQTIKECLHTFCNGCIRHHFYRYKDPRCPAPTCDTRLGIKPWTQLLPDPTIQALVSKLLPDDREPEEAKRAAFYAKLGIKRKRSEDPQAPSARPRAPSSASTAGPSPNQMIRFKLLPQRSSSVPLFLRVRAISFPRVHTQALLKIMYIHKFVAKKLGLRRPEEVEILCRGVPVGPEHTLQFVQRTQWKANAKMVLEFRLAPAGVEARLLAAGKAAGRAAAA